MCDKAFSIRRTHHSRARFTGCYSADNKQSWRVCVICAVAIAAAAVLHLALTSFIESYFVPYHNWRYFTVTVTYRAVTLFPECKIYKSTNFTK